MRFKVIEKQDFVNVSYIFEGKPEICALCKTNKWGLVIHSDDKEEDGSFEWIIQKTGIDEGWFLCCDECFNKEIRPHYECRWDTV